MQKINFKAIMDRVINKAPGLVVGSVASNFVATQVTKLSKGQAAPMMVAGAQIVAGALVPAFLGKGKGKAGFIEAVADGMMAQGAVQLAKALNIPGISGMDNDMSAEEDWVSATEETLNGPDATLNGND